jgi:hypothetical protein
MFKAFALLKEDEGKEIIKDEYIVYTGMWNSLLVECSSPEPYNVISYILTSLCI